MKDITIIMIALVIGAVILMPSLFSGFGDLLDRLADWVQYGTDLSDGDGQAGINLKVYGTDGSMKELNILPMQFYPLFLPIDPSDPDVELDRLEADLIATLQYEGTLVDYDADWVYAVDIKDDANDQVYSFGTWSQHFTGDWDSGTSLIYTASGNPIFTKQTIHASEIESVMAGKASGNYKVKFELTVTIDVEFEDSVTDSKSGQATALYTFSWDETGAHITSLAINIDAVPLG